MLVAPHRLRRTLGAPSGHRSLGHSTTSGWSEITRRQTACMGGWTACRSAMATSATQVGCPLCCCPRAADPAAQPMACLAAVPHILHLGGLVAVGWCTSVLLQRLACRALRPLWLGLPGPGGRQPNLDLHHRTRQLPLRLLHRSGSRQARCFQWLEWALAACLVGSLARIRPPHIPVCPPQAKMATTCTSSSGRSTCAAWRPTTSECKRGAYLILLGVGVCSYV
jgi:hypothetical protein